MHAHELTVRFSAAQSSFARCRATNRFTDEAPLPPIELPDFAELAERQTERLAVAKASRDGGAVARALQAIKAAAEGSEPLMPPLLVAVRQRSTIGEISDVLRDAWGVYQPGR